MIKAAKKINAIDLFCGAGGTTAGAEASGFVEVKVAINHWQVAIRSHSANHPGAQHICASVDHVHPDAWANQDIELILASPECVGHSNARGGRPVQDQRRATAWCVPRFAEAIRPKWLVIENVREFVNWAPLIEKRDKRGRVMLDKETKRPLMISDKTRKGAIFQAWVATLQAIGYHLEWRLLNAADFGDATKRTRLIIIGRLGPDQSPIPWPVPSHSKGNWVAAATIIDWEIPTPSIFGRKKNLADKTLRRVEIGLRKFANRNATPYVVKLYGSSDVDSIDQPLSTVTAGANHHALAEVLPFQVDVHDSRRDDGKATSLDDPLPTVVTKPGNSLVTAFVVPNFGERDGQAPRTHDLADPLPTVTSHGAGQLVLAEPFVAHVAGPGSMRIDESGVQGLDEPLRTVLTREDRALVKPFVLQARGPRCNDETYAGVRGVDEPLPTIMTSNNHGVVKPFVMQTQGPGYNDERYDGVRGVDEPLPTILARNNHGLVAPYLVDVNHGDGDKERGDRVHPVTEPLGAVTTKRGKAIVQPFMLPRQGFYDSQVDKPPRSLDEPLPTIIASHGPGHLVTPIVTQFNGTGGASTVDEPLSTIATRNRHGLALPIVVDTQSLECLTPAAREYADPNHPNQAMHRVVMTMLELGICDVCFRMFAVAELAAAQGFDPGYRIYGNKEQQIKQIGNAVPKRMMQAICSAIGDQQNKPKRARRA